MGENIELENIDKARLRLALASHISGLEKFKEGTSDQAVLDFVDTEIRPYKDLHKRLEPKRFGQRV